MKRLITPGAIGLTFRSTKWMGCHVPLKKRSAARVDWELEVLKI